MLFYAIVHSGSPSSTIVAVSILWAVGTRLPFYSLQLPNPRLDLASAWLGSLLCSLQRSAGKSWVRPRSDAIALLGRRAFGLTLYLRAEVGASPQKLKPLVSWLAVRYARPERICPAS